MTKLESIAASSSGSRPFLSHAVHIVGVFESVSAVDPLSPLIRAVTPFIFTWSYIPLYDSNMLDVPSCCQMLMAIAFDVCPDGMGTWNVFCTLITTVAVSLCERAARLLPRVLPRMFLR